MNRYYDPDNFVNPWGRKPDKMEGGQETLKEWIELENSKNKSVMKKYKLIKEYPGSPEIGTILTYIGWNDTLSWIEDNPEKAKEFWQEVKEKPLFTTEDGVDIYDKSRKIWVVNVNLKCSDQPWLKTAKSCECLYIAGNKMFAYKDNAAKYYVENKPRFSKKEIRDAMHHLRLKYGYPTFYDLKKHLEL